MQQENNEGDPLISLKFYPRRRGEGQRASTLSRKTRDPFLTFYLPPTINTYGGIYFLRNTTGHTFALFEGKTFNVEKAGQSPGDFTSDSRIFTRGNVSMRGIFECAESRNADNVDES